mgnify:CR=1 FL=1
MRKIVFDIETKQLIPAGWPDSHIEKLEISNGGLYDFENNNYELFALNESDSIFVKREVLENTDLNLQIN